MKRDQGLENLVKKYRKIFRVPENINHYSEEHFRKAEKRFVRNALRNGNPQPSISELRAPQGRTEPV